MLIEPITEVMLRGILVKEMTCSLVKMSKQGLKRIIRNKPIFWLMKVKIRI
ncbi:hypothetical protein KKD45_00375 [Patescibacteria group bacterium]|nr:hypothetical protein [Patescibacteria group bacterium]MBU4308960.1 hypothetical protein [Patescibacteria group bacterium]MBU4577320.1 hypothetical protein [Patescibacteria group bacterium]